jgi:CHASE2 domain-containing sensor protein
MCACGCFLVAGILATIAWCAIHGLWLPVAALVLALGAVGWWGSRLRKKTAETRKRPGG